MSESFVKTPKRDPARPAVLPDAGAILANLLGWIEEILRDSPALQAKFRLPREFIRLSA